MWTPQIFAAPGARRLTVTPSTEGWKVSEEEGGRTVRTATCTDWHRVERAIARFTQVEVGQTGLAADYSTNP